MLETQTINKIQKDKVDLTGVIRNTYKKMGRAIADYQMLAEGDKLALAVSGGMDSLSLLKLFQLRRSRIPIDFDFIVVFIDTNFIHIDKQALLDYLYSTGEKVVVKNMRLDESQVNCFYCAWNRRRILFETAREYGCNKVALGHHLDDVIETTLMNMFFLGEISTMKPNLEIFDGKLRIIRPLCYLQKRQLVKFAQKFDFPDTHYECPYGKTSQRQAVKEMIDAAAKKHPHIKTNIFRSLRKIKKDYLL